MKWFLFFSLMTSLSFAEEIRTTLSESENGLAFSLYEISYPGEEAPLWDFMKELVEKETVTSDRSFSFKCHQSQVTKSVYETRCTGHLKRNIYPTTLGSFGDDFISIYLAGQSATDFANIFKSSNYLSINVQDKFIINGDQEHLSILVRH